VLPPCQTLSHGRRRCPHAVTFLVYWFMQGAWVFVTSLPLLLLNASGANFAWGWADAVGVAAWAAGLAIEATADWQKQAFRSDPVNRGRFVDVGLWRLARYPNYFGEMLLWWGAWLACSPAFHGAQWLSVLCPAADAALLLFVSGVPLQERQARERWGGTEEYERYVRSTRLLLPLPSAWRRGGAEQS
jgi:steroid 5-alpha reductase family enzyme